jgi:hypothetical protein
MRLNSRDRATPLLRGWICIYVQEEKVKHVSGMGAKRLAEVEGDSGGG